MNGRKRPRGGLVNKKSPVSTAGESRAVTINPLYAKEQSDLLKEEFSGQEWSPLTVRSVYEQMFCNCLHNWCPICSHLRLLNEVT